VDCLVCHEKTGTYRKLPGWAGHPVYQDVEFPPHSGKIVKAVDLKAAAQSVAKTGRNNCGACHFFGGGGDAVKHGDIDTSLSNPGKYLDVHMDKDGLNFSCGECHKTSGHEVPGSRYAVTAKDEGGKAHMRGKEDKNPATCQACHGDRPHQNDLLHATRLNNHAGTLACQSCHIPTFAKARPTKTWWDWSTAGKDIKAEDIPKDQYGMKLYDKMKGDFKWDKDVMPTYLWFNGNIERYHAGDKIDPTKAVKLTHVTGGRNDPHSKIYPFKIMRGKQAYDRGNNTIAYVRVFGPPGSDAYWQKYDWDRAIASGMKAAGQPYSGRFGFVETTMIWPVHHMVVSRDRSLKCGDCHGENGRFDWKALGYKGDPRDPKNR